MLRRAGSRQERPAAFRSCHSSRSFCRACITSPSRSTQPMIRRPVLASAVSHATSTAQVGIIRPRALPRSTMTIARLQGALDFARQGRHPAALCHAALHLHPVPGGQHGRRACHAPHVVSPALQTRAVLVPQCTSQANACTVWSCPTSIHAMWDDTPSELEQTHARRTPQGSTLTLSSARVQEAHEAGS